MNQRCLIISGGEECPLPPEIKEADYVIACDRGYLYAERMGLKPDLIVGDFDSAPLPETGIRVERLPSRKDDTDTMIAARHAAEKGYGEAVILCCFGGRLDHTLANLQTGAWLAERGVTARLIGADTEAAVFASGTLRFPRREGWSLSLFALSDRCEGVRIRGTKYDGEGLTLTNAFPLGVSNVWTSEVAEITVHSGIMMVMQSLLKEGEHI